MTSPQQTSSLVPTPSRAERTSAAILAATREIVAEGGVRALTVEGVAARSGVAKTSIYRRWSGRHELALAVLLELVPDPAAAPDFGDLRRELEHHVGRTMKVLRNTPMGRVLRGLVSDLASDLELFAAFRVQVIARRMADTQIILERAIARGEIPPGVDYEFAHELLFGPVYYRLLLSGEPLRAKLATQLVDALLATLTAGGTPTAGETEAAVAVATSGDA